MNSNYSFTYIIGYRHSIERLQNLKRVLDWISGFSNVEVLLIEQDTHSKISHINLKAKHTFIKSNMPYNRSWSFNVAMKRANSKVLVFGDSDIIMDPNLFISGLNALKNNDMISPYNSVIDLTKQESNLPLENILKIDRPGRGNNDNQKINICGGIVMFNLESIQKIGGWDESFWGWGGEDDYQSFKVKNLLTWTELNGGCFHLYHNRVQPDAKYYQRNLQILKEVSTLNKEQLQKVILNQIPKIGWKNKCDNF